MKSSGVPSMTAASLLLIALIGQVGSFKLYPSVSTSSDVSSVPYSVQQQEEAIRREQLQQQHQFELLQQQQHQAELQIQQQQLEAQRLAGRPLGLQPQQSHEFSTKGVAPAPAPVAQPQQFTDSYSYDRQQYGPPRSTIAYLVVRPPYQMPLPYDESVYQRNYQPMIRPYNIQTEYARPEAPFAGTKGARQEDYPPQPPPPPPPAQPALVVPVHGDKHGKLRAMLDKLMSKLSFSSYEVSGEEYVAPVPCNNCRPPIKQEAPIVQQPITQQQAFEQTHDEEDSRHISQQPIQQQPIQQQQQQQSFIEQDKDQGFEEPPKSAPLPPKPLEPIKQEQAKLEEFSQQQQAQLPVQEQEQLDFSRQPQAAAKGVQLPARQPEAVQQQRLEEVSGKGGPKRYQQQQQQQYFVQQQAESVRQEPKGGF